jgi:hypothetical protein
MSSTSQVSSLDAQNGSARYFCRSHSDASANSTFRSYQDNSSPQGPYTGVANPSEHPAATTSASLARSIFDMPTNTNDHYLYYGYSNDNINGAAHANGDHSHLTASNDSNPYAYQPQSLPNTQTSLQDQQYYLQATSHPDVPNYGTELIIDSVEDVQGSRHLAQPDHGSDRPRHQLPDSNQRRTPHQQTAQARNVARSLTARRWSREYSPEERMRVALPRWATEQDRLDYECRQRPTFRSS